MGIAIEENNESDIKIAKMSKLEKDTKMLSIGNLLALSRSSADYSWWMCLSFLTCTALITRLSYLSYLPGTTWDEVHFGGYATQYINRTFYHDVHPPLGKIIIAAAMYVTGYKGNFNFSEANLYDDSIRYQLVRSEMAVLGALIVPIAFLTVWELSRSLGASCMAGLGILCDTFLHKINSLILLDPLLNFTICCAVFCTFKFYSYRERGFSWPWWGWLSSIGVSLGLVMSIKYVGVFTVCFVGLHTACQLYEIACDKSYSIWNVVPHTAARVLCLIVLPILIYLGGFVLHLAILTESKPDGGGWLHSRFFGTLNNTEYDNKTFAQFVNYGSNVTIQSSDLHVGYLESWFDLFPSELTAACQVVSTLTLRDPEATEWVIKKVDIEKGSVIDPSNPTEPPMAISNGDWVMLTHLGTSRSLRSHNRRAPFTRRLYQVCGYGDDGAGGPFETWQLIIPGVPIGEPLQVFAHDFMLKNYKMDCYLSASDVSLPKEWANEGSKEVACSRNRKYPTLLWHINWIDTQKVIGETTIKDHQMGLWERIQQLHKIMFNMNAGLTKTEDEENEDISVSRPWMWPLCYSLQLLGGYSDDPKNEEVNIFSVAVFNPVIAYTNVVAFLILLWLVVYHYLKVLRNSEELPYVVERRKQVLWSCMWLGLVWLIHYFPFFFMNRVLYIHHYCPAYIYSCMITGVVLNYVCDTLSEVLKGLFRKNYLQKSHLLAIPAIAFIASYVCFFPMATYIEGKMFYPTYLNNYLDRLYFGQYWYALGYNNEIYNQTTYVSMMIPLENQEENPDLNATLYYNTELNTTIPDKVEEGQITPFAASNFTSQRERSVLESTTTAEEGSTDDIPNGVKMPNYQNQSIDDTGSIDDKGSIDMKESIDVKQSTDGKGSIDDKRPMDDEGSIEIKESIDVNQSKDVKVSANMKESAED